MSYGFFCCSEKKLCILQVVLAIFVCHLNRLWVQGKTLTEASGGGIGNPDSEMHLVNVVIIL